MFKWIDVSCHNGVIDWPRVAASGVSGAVLRAGYGNDAAQKDICFDANIKGALAAGLKVAVYWFSYADSVDDALKEWQVCRQIILPYRGQICFVASDYEYDSYNYYQRVHGTAPSNDLINQMVPRRSKSGRLGHGTLHQQRLPPERFLRRDAGGVGYLACGLYRWPGCAVRHAADRK